MRKARQLQLYQQTIVTGYVQWHIRDPEAVRKFMDGNSGYQYFHKYDILDGPLDAFLQKLEEYYDFDKEAFLNHKYPESK